jgi:hypothetical protein
MQRHTICQTLDSEGMVSGCIARRHACVNVLGSAVVGWAHLGSHFWSSPTSCLLEVCRQVPSMANQCGIHHSVARAIAAGACEVGHARNRDQAASDVVLLVCTSLNCLLHGEPLPCIGASRCSLLLALALYVPTNNQKLTVNSNMEELNVNRRCEKRLHTYMTPSVPGVLAYLPT